MLFLKIFSKQIFYKLYFKKSVKKILPILLKVSVTKVQLISLVPSLRKTLLIP